MFEEGNAFTMEAVQQQLDDLAAKHEAQVGPLDSARAWSRLHTQFSSRETGVREAGHTWQQSTGASHILQTRQ